MSEPLVVIDRLLNLLPIMGLTALRTHEPMLRRLKRNVTWGCFGDEDGKQLERLRELIERESGYITWDHGD